MRRDRRTIGVLAACALALAACAELQKSATDYVKRTGTDTAQKVSANAVNAAASGELTKSASFTMEQEFHLGKTICANVVARLGGNALPPEHATARYVRDVGTVVALAAAEGRRDDDRPYPLKGYRFLVVRAGQVNAVGMPGGFVAVTTGAIGASVSEDELAAVVAHEVAHVQRGHAMRPVERAREQEHLTGTLLAGTNEIVHQFFGKVVNLGTDLVLDRGFGRSDELEADAIAVRTLEVAGYDADALRQFLSRLEGKAAEGGFFARHPPSAERVAALRKLGAVATAPAPPVTRVVRFREGARGLD